MGKVIGNRRILRVPFIVTDMIISSSNLPMDERKKLSQMLIEEAAKQSPGVYRAMVTREPANDCLVHVAPALKKAA
ncbi:hypothetical protein D3C83_161080 [compost metagenome]